MRILSTVNQGGMGPTGANRDAGFLLRNNRFLCLSWLKTGILIHPRSERERTKLAFLDASTHLYKRLCPSVGPSVRRLVRPSVGP